MALKHLMRQFCAKLPVALTFLLLVAGQPVFSPAAEVTPVDQKAYLHALRDAEVTSQNEICRRLVAIVPENDHVNRTVLHGGQLVWEGEPGGSRLLVATYMSRASYEQYYKENLEQQAEEYLLKKSLWVTVIPELKNFFVDQPRCPPTAKRVKQLLGLHPAYDYEVLLELWVNPLDLFRPSADPEITDHEAEPADKVEENVWVFPTDRNKFLKIDNTVLFKDSAWSTAVPFTTWYVDRAQTIYAIGDENDSATWGWPWTRLGYTYDWGNAGSHVGASEFVIRIDPDVEGGQITVKLERAVDSDTPEWDSYFRCGAEDMATSHHDGSALKNRHVQ